eukprot:15882375-Heterocapsa_arctica.AAC.1
MRMPIMRMPQSWTWSWTWSCSLHGVGLGGLGRVDHHEDDESAVRPQRLSHAARCRDVAGLDDVGRE